MPDLQKLHRWEYWHFYSEAYQALLFSTKFTWLRTSEITDQDLGSNLDYNGSSPHRCSGPKEIHPTLVKGHLTVPFRAHRIALYCEQINLSGFTISLYDEYLCEIPC